MNSPKIPDPSEGAIAGINADLKNYPFTYMVDALAQKGGKGTINGKQYDFTGLGQADVSAQVSDKMAQALLDIQQNYGADYIKQRLQELQQSDPTGYADRQQLFDKIIADANANPDRPLADQTQQQILDLLGKDATLDPKETEQVQQGVRGQQLANGIYLGNAPASAEASAVTNAGEAQRTQRQEQAQAYLSSGVSPEDVQYRRIQQSLSNLGAFTAGTSPMAEFGSLSAAGNGAAPFTTAGLPNAQMNPNAGLNGMQNAATQYQGISNYNNQQVNPFTAGLQGGMGGLQAMGSLGFNFGAGQTSYGIPSSFSGTPDVPLSQQYT